MPFNFLFGLKFRCLWGGGRQKTAAEQPPQIRLDDLHGNLIRSVPRPLIKAVVLELKSLGKNSSFQLLSMFLVRLWAKHFISMVAFDPQDISLSKLLTFSTPFYRWVKWGPGKCSNLSKVPQLPRGRAGSTWICPQRCALSPGPHCRPWSGNEALSHLSILGLTRNQSFTP